MKKLALLLAFNLFISQAFATSILTTGAGKPSGGAGPIVPARVQGNSQQNGSTSSTTVVVTLPAPVTSGNAVILSVGTTGNVPANVLTVADDKGNTYTAGNAAQNGSLGYSFGTYYLSNITNAPQTITVTFNLSFAFTTMLVEEFSGILAASPVDGGTAVNQNIGTAGANAITTGNITTTAAGDLIYASTVSIDGLGSTLTAGTGYTAGISLSIDFKTEYQVQSSAGSIAGTFGFTGSGGNYINAILALKHK